MEDDGLSNASEARSLDQINELANIAGLTRRKGLVQTLTFDNDLSSSQFRLLELPKELISTINEGESIVIRGDPNEEAVLCTDAATYEMKAADTSNAFLLLPSLKTAKRSDFQGKGETVEDVKICGSLSTYYELKKSKPKCAKLKQVLSRTKYRGPEHEAEAQGATKYTFADLKRTIQASEAEIKNELEKIGAFLVDGYWRILDVCYQEKAFSQVLKLVEEEQWTLDEIPLERTCEVLEELYPKTVLENCLKTYGEAVSYEDKPGIIYRLSEEKVCQFFAECILRGADKFDYHEFFEAWQQSVPDGLHTNKEQLKGLALDDLSSHPPVIWHFPSYDLPEDPSARFNLLFKVRSKWSRDEIEPYISELCGPGRPMNSLLLKYARSSTDAAGKKMYNSKRPIS